MILLRGRRFSPMGRLVRILLNSGAHGKTSGADAGFRSARTSGRRVRVARPGPVPLNGFEDLARRPVLAHGHDVDAPGETGDPGGELAGDREALGPFVLGAFLVGAAHPVLDGLRDDDA